MKKHILVLFAFLAACSVFYVGCSEDAPLVATGVSDYVVIDGNGCATLWAGQTINVGTVCVAVDNDNNSVTVTYTTTGGWMLQETHLYAGLGSLSAMPQTRTGNPIPGHFPYGGDVSGTTATYTIPLSTFGLDASMTTCSAVGAFAAHAVVTNGSQTEGAWGGGSQPARIVSRGNWAYWFSVDFSCESPVTPVAAHGDARVYASSGADNLCTGSWTDPPTSNCANPTDTFAPGTWGWTNALSGPGTYTLDLGGAPFNSSCSNLQTESAGSMSVVYNTDGTATVTLTTSGVNELVSADLWIGSTPFYIHQGPNCNSSGYSIGHVGSWPHRDANATVSNSTTRVWNVTGLGGGTIYVLVLAVV